MVQANAGDVDLVGESPQLPTSMQCLRDDLEEDAHVVSFKQSPAPKQWAARKGAVDDDESWALEKEWGRQHGFRESQLNEIENVLELMAGRTIPAQAISGGVQLDRGSFGEIFSATLHVAGPPPSTLPIAVKRVDQNSTPEGTTMPQVCCPIPVTGHAARWASPSHLACRQHLSLIASAGRCSVTCIWRWPSRRFSSIQTYLPAQFEIPTSQVLQRATDKPDVFPSAGRRLSGDERRLPGPGRVGRSLPPGLRL
jgi:hypothetical protein